jgi:hypothetical protein
LGINGGSHPDTGAGCDVFAIAGFLTIFMGISRNQRSCLNSYTDKAYVYFFAQKVRLYSFYLSHGSEQKVFGSYQIVFHHAGFFLRGFQYVFCPPGKRDFTSKYGSSDTHKGIADVPGKVIQVYSQKSERSARASVSAFQNGNDNVFG